MTRQEQRYGDWLIVSYKHWPHPHYPDWSASAYLKRGKQVQAYYANGRNREEAIAAVVKMVDRGSVD